MKIMQHPKFKDVFQQVDDKAVDDWKDTGWKLSSQKAADEASVDVKPADQPAVSA